MPGLAGRPEAQGTPASSPTPHLQGPNLLCSRRPLRRVAKILQELVLVIVLLPVQQVHQTKELPADQAQDVWELLPMNLSGTSSQAHLPYVIGSSNDGTSLQCTDELPFSHRLPHMSPPHIVLNRSACRIGTAQSVWLSCLGDTLPRHSSMLPCSMHGSRRHAGKCCKVRTDAGQHPGTLRAAPA